jgi:sortase A
VAIRVEFPACAGRSLAEALRPRRSRGIVLLQLALLAVFITSTALYLSRTIARAAAQHQDRAAAAQWRAQDRGAAGAKRPAVLPEFAESSRRDTPDGPLGVIRIPRLKLEATVRDGVDDRTLKLAVGRIPGTSATPRAGNMGFAAHRDTHFRPLRDVRLRDRVQLQTPDGTYDYVVTDLVIVAPEDVWVLDSGPRPSLTLITCYPFTYVGAAPRRFVVRAELAGAGPPARTAASTGRQGAGRSR